MYFEFSLVDVCRGCFHSCRNATVYRMFAYPRSDDDGREFFSLMSVGLNVREKSDV